MVSTLPAFYYSRKGLVCGFAPLFRHVLQGLFALCLCPKLHIKVFENYQEKSPFGANFKNFDLFMENYLVTL